MVMVLVINLPKMVIRMMVYGMVVVVVMVERKDYSRVIEEVMEDSVEVVVEVDLQVIVVEEEEK